MIIIIGAGLSGLLTAYRLKKENIPFRILEARDRVGGRIHTLYKQNTAPLEMGATWFGAQHRQLIALLDEIGIEHFEQYMEGKAFYQSSATAPAEAIQIPPQAPSYRIKGGTSALINKLYQVLDKEEVLLNQTVRAITYQKQGITVRATTDFECDKVVLAIPPKLWASNIHFEPALTTQLIQTAHETHTWMEDSIKLAISYEKPFWQAVQLSGTLFSNAGPITEFYDHSDYAREKYALCGFVNAAYKQLSTAERKQHILKQLKSVFGEQAIDFTGYEEAIWSEETHTFQSSEAGHYPHQNNGDPLYRKAYYDGRLLMASSEASTISPGYMDGAVYAAETAAGKIIGSVKAMVH